jgi:hypothetical protein
MALVNRILGNCRALPHRAHGNHPVLPDAMCANIRNKWAIQHHIDVVW